VLFPLGDLDKAAVRERARRAGLPVCDKPDSTGICFIGERPFAEFLRKYLPDDPGPIETPAGERLGTHRGLHFYTLGQRGGLELGGQRGHAEEPWYVARKIPERKALIVVQSHEAALLNCSALRAINVNWLCAAPTAPFAAAIKLRYRQPDQAAGIQPDAGGGMQVQLTAPQRAVATGQSAVVYAGERCLGGGVIAETL